MVNTRALGKTKARLKEKQHENKHPRNHDGDYLKITSSFSNDAMLAKDATNELECKKHP